MQYSHGSSISGRNVTEAVIWRITARMPSWISFSDFSLGLLQENNDKYFTSVE